MNTQTANNRFCTAPFARCSASCVNWALQLYNNSFPTAQCDIAQEDSAALRWRHRRRQARTGCAVQHPSCVWNPWFHTRGLCSEVQSLCKGKQSRTLKMAACFLKCVSQMTGELSLHRGSAVTCPVMQWGTQDGAFSGGGVPCNKTLGGSHVVWLPGNSPRLRATRNLL